MKEFKSYSELWGWLQDKALEIHENKELETDEQIINFFLNCSDQKLVDTIFNHFTRSSCDSFSTSVHYQFIENPDRCFEINYTPNGLILTRESKEFYEALKEKPQVLQHGI